MDDYNFFKKEKFFNFVNSNKIACSRRSIYDSKLMLKRVIIKSTLPNENCVGLQALVNTSILKLLKSLPVRKDGRDFKIKFHKQISATRKKTKKEIIHSTNLLLLQYWNSSGFKHTDLGWLQTFVRLVLINTTFNAKYKVSLWQRLPSSCIIKIKFFNFKATSKKKLHSSTHTGKSVNVFFHLSLTPPAIRIGMTRFFHNIIMSLALKDLFNNLRLI